MESHKNRILRLTNNIYNMKCGDMMTISRCKDDGNVILKCQCIDGNYDLYGVNDKHTSWGMSCETIDDLKDSLLKDVLDGVIYNIKKV